MHHIVPRGAGGANSYRNLGTLCRRCHDAIHYPDVQAPTVRLESTGDMTKREFNLFYQLVDEMLPALSRQVISPGLKTQFNLGNQKQWHVALCDIKRLDEALSEEDRGYASFQLQDYM